MLRKIAYLLLAVLSFTASPKIGLAQRAIALMVSSLRCEYLTNLHRNRHPRTAAELANRQQYPRRKTNCVSDYRKLFCGKSHREQGRSVGHRKDCFERRQFRLLIEASRWGRRQRCFWKVRVWDQNGVSTWSKPAQWAMGLLLPADWSAKWIGDKLPSVENLSAAMLRREFKLSSRARRAIVYASALGVYEMHINGKRVGNDLLAPEFTDYHARTQYQAYDVTALLRPGANAIGAVLGDGWYAGGIGLARSVIKKPRNIYGDHPRFIAQLEVELADGKTERVVTDESWRTSREGPIVQSDILDGEVYDARREMPGWDSAGFDDKAWKTADVASNVRTTLVAQPNEPIRVTQEIKPISVSEPKPGVYVFDLGQNMVGWCRLRVQGAAGTTVTIRHAEMLSDDGTIYTDNLRAAKQTDAYTAVAAASRNLRAALHLSRFSLCRSHRSQEQAAARCNHRPGV